MYAPAVAGLLISTVVKAALSIAEEHEHDKSLDFLNLFRRAITDASDKQDKVYKKLHESMRGGGNQLGIPTRRDVPQLAIEVDDVLES